MGGAGAGWSWARTLGAADRGTLRGRLWSTRALGTDHWASKPSAMPGAVPSFKRGYYGFPGEAICASINEQVVHGGTPAQRRSLAGRRPDLKSTAGGNFSKAVQTGELGGSTVRGGRR